MKLYLKEEHPLLYFSGTGSHGMGEEDIIKQGAKYRCYSYAYVHPDGFYFQKKMKEAMDVSIKNKLGIMMDSSAHSFHRLTKEGMRKSKGRWTVNDILKLRDQTVESYAKYVNKEGKNWDFAVTFDYLKQCKVIYQMTKQLKSLGADTTPVYHGDQPLEWLERYCKDGHKLICIGSTSRSNKPMRYYLDRVFNVATKHNVLLHGLAYTSLTLMFGYPFYSVDSATWAKVAAYGCILCTSETVNETLGYIHMTDRRHGQSRGIEYSELSPVQRKALTTEINNNGFNVKDLVESGAARSLYNIFVFSHKLRHLKQDLVDGKQRWKSLLV